MRNQIPSDKIDHYPRSAQLLSRRKQPTAAGGISPVFIPSHQNAVDPAAEAGRYDALF